MALTNTWIELDPEVLGRNIDSLRAALGPDVEPIFVVKSDAYGHGMVPVARCAGEHGVRWYAVSHLAEALDLRTLVPDATVLIVGAIGPDEVPSAVEAGVVCVLVSEEHAASLARAKAPGPLRCHAKIDTGMGRLGFPWENAAGPICSLAVNPAFALEGLCTHFASSDAPDRAFTDAQAERFASVVAACRDRGLPSLFLHASNSGGILRDAAWDMDGVRPGILLYGYAAGAREGTPDAEECRVRTRPFLQWKTRVLQVKRVPAGFPVSYDSTFVTDRETCIATIDAGYADGYSRRLSNRGAVVIGGRRRQIAGRVTMNLVTVDAGPEDNVRPGDEVVLIGEQDGSSVWADDLAGWCDTIPYEILTSIRTDRRVVKG